jgi:hypothetical protein
VLAACLVLNTDCGVCDLVVNKEGKLGHHGTKNKLYDVLSILLCEVNKLQVGQIVNKKKLVRDYQLSKCPRVLWLLKSVLDCELAVSHVLSCCCCCRAQL